MLASNHLTLQLCLVHEQPNVAHKEPANDIWLSQTQIQFVISELYCNYLDRISYINSRFGSRILTLKLRIGALLEKNRLILGARATLKNKGSEKYIRGGRFLLIFLLNGFVKIVQSHIFCNDPGSLSLDEWKQKVRHRLYICRIIKSSRFSVQV